MSVKLSTRCSSVAAIGLTVCIAACSSSPSPGAEVNPTTATSSSPAGNAAASSGASLDGKRVLVSPYWLDNFNTANTSWIKRSLESMGASVDIVNPNAVASKQLSVLETAVASQNYDLIIWQPVDNVSAPTQIRKLQAAMIPQVVNFTSIKNGDNGLNFSVVTTDLKTQYREAGLAAAKYIKAHPELGPASIAVINDDPTSEYCTQRTSGLVEAVKSVLPSAKVVFNGGAKSQAEATSKMTDFITRDIPFNIFGGCGGAVSLGGIAAIRAAKLGDAVNKVPGHVYMTSFDGSPPELELLWNPTTSLMRSGGVFPKDAADVAVKLAIDELTGKTAYDAGAEGTVKAVWFTPDCAKFRPIALEQFAGVEGFSIPKCTFKYNSGG